MLDGAPARPGAPLAGARRHRQPACARRPRAARRRPPATCRPGSSPPTTAPVEPERALVGRGRRGHARRGGRGGRVEPADGAAAARHARPHARLLRGRPGHRRDAGARRSRRRASRWSTGRLGSGRAGMSGAGPALARTARRELPRMSIREDSSAPTISISYERALMFTGIVTDIGRDRAVEHAGDAPPPADRSVLRSGDDRARRLDRLRRAVPDGRGVRRRATTGCLVRGRCRSRDAGPHHCRRMAGRARASTWSARSRSATNSAAISSPATWTASPPSSPARRSPPATSPGAPTARFDIRAPHAAGPLHRREGLGLPRRHVADRQHGRGRRLLGARSSRTPLRSPPGASAQAGDALNLEVDLMARYAARLAEARPQGREPTVSSGSEKPGGTAGRLCRTSRGFPSAMRIAIHLL